MCQYVTDKVHCYSLTEESGDQADVKASCTDTLANLETTAEEAFLRPHLEQGLTVADGDQLWIGAEYNLFAGSDWRWAESTGTVQTLGKFRVI